jgi:DNA invertase Pin-like site-specific DNA recombinase
MTTKTQAFGYLRVSGKGQVEGDGFDRQRDTIGKYARRAGIQVAEWYRDEGVSGTKELAQRAGLAALLDRLESNGVKIVLVERADRLARDLMVSEVILAQFRKIGVRVLAAESGTDLTASQADPTSTLIRQVLGAVSEFDKSVTVLKLRAARDRKRQTTGKCEGRKAFGERPGEGPIVDLILSLRRKRPGGRAMSYAAIAERLNSDGQRTRYGGPWLPSTVQSILKHVRKP